MSKSILQQNLEKLIKEGNYQVSELEKKAGLKKNNIYFILKGTSKKPSAELLQSVAKVLGVTVKDLFASSPEESFYLNQNDFPLIQAVLENVIEEATITNFSITAVSLCDIVLEAFDYCRDSKAVDRKFINWTIKQRSQRK